VKTHSFNLFLTADAISLEGCDKLYEAGCDDGTIVTRNGQTYIHFDRDAESLENAIRSAFHNVRRAGFEVSRLEMDSDDLLAVAQS
jgi:hypothetical protein